MPKFRIQVGRDARVYYKTTIEADSLDQAQEGLSRHGYEGDHDWEFDGVDDFDEVETACILDETDTEILSSYTSGDGWDHR